MKSVDLWGWQIIKRLEGTIIIYDLDHLALAALIAIRFRS